MKGTISSRLALLALMVLVLGLLMVGTAAAQENDPYSNEGPKILPSVVERSEPNRPPVIAPERDTTPNGERGALPFTGADLTLFVATGLAAVATGGVILRRARSRSLQ